MSAGNSGYFSSLRKIVPLNPTTTACFSSICCTAMKCVPFLIDSFFHDLPASSLSTGDFVLLYVIADDIRQLAFATFRKHSEFAVSRR